MGDKLKKTEEHLLRLLALRKQQSTADRAKARGGCGRRLASATAAASGSKGRALAGAGGGAGEMLVGTAYLVRDDLSVHAVQEWQHPVSKWTGGWMSSVCMRFPASRCCSCICSCVCICFCCVFGPIFSFLCSPVPHNTIYLYFFFVRCFFIFLVPCYSGQFRRSCFFLMDVYLF